MDKNEVSGFVKEWFNYDEEIKKLNTLIKDLRTKQKNLSQVLVLNMKEFDINQFETTKGKLLHTEKKIRGSVTKKHLISCLNELISDEEDRKRIIEYIYDNREIKIVDSIKRK